GDDRFRRESAAVDAAFEHRRMQFVRPVDQRGTRIGQKLGEVEAMPALGLERTIGAKAVARALRYAFKGAVEHLAGAALQRHARDLVVARIVEQAKMDRARMRGKNG